MNISFTSKQQEYISSQVKSGDFQNASEVVRDALRLHQVYRERLLKDLKSEIEKGWQSPVSSKKIGDILQGKTKNV